MRLRADGMRAFEAAPALPARLLSLRRLRREPELDPAGGGARQSRPMPPAARVGDMHVCPMVTPGTPPIPHVGGPILPPGAVTVLIGGVPAARMGDMCVCTGPPDSIVVGSPKVMIGGKPAARMGDSTAHGGTITVGFPQVMIN